MEVDRQRRLHGLVLLSRPLSGLYHGAVLEAHLETMGVDECQILPLARQP